MRERGLIVKRSTLLMTVLFTVACSGQAPFSSDDNSDDDSTDSGSNDASTSSDGSAPTPDSGTSDATTKVDTGVDAGMDTGTTMITVDNSDGFGAARQACIDEINKLRATESHAAYAIWDDTATDKCVDEQATYDQTADSAHDAWINNVYPTCNGNAQDECLGYGTSPSETVACLDAMWNERLQSNCSGCAACNGPTLTESIIECQSTSTCDFYGNYGPECGHYLNMSADYFSYAACGFSTKGTSGDWAVQNFK